jgi:uncharacterized protein YjbJ (UPF0337 family)
MVAGFRKQPVAPPPCRRYLSPSRYAAAASIARLAAGPQLDATRREARVDWITIESDWDEYKVAAKQQWDRLSEQQLHGTRGKREYLLRRVQEAYSLSRGDAERQISEWLAKQTEKRAATGS